MQRRMTRKTLISFDDIDFFSVPVVETRLTPSPRALPMGALCLIFIRGRGGFDWDYFTGKPRSRMRASIRASRPRKAR